MPLQVVDVLETANIPIKFQKVVTSYLGYTDVHSMSEIADAIAGFDWEVEVATKSRGLALHTTTEYHPELKKKVLFTQVGDRILCYMTLLSKISPCLFINHIDILTVEISDDVLMPVISFVPAIAFRSIVAFFEVYFMMKRKKEVSV